MKGIALIFIFIIALSYPSFAQESTCDYKVEILIDGEEFKAEDFTWRMRATKIEGKSTNITGTAEIKANGKTVKSYKPWTSDSISKQKTSSEYTPNLKAGNYEIVAEIKVDCDDVNKNNNVDTSKIKITGEEKKTETQKIDEDKQAPKIMTTDIKTKEKISDEINKKEIVTTPPQKLKSTTNEETDNTIQLTTNGNKNKIAQSTAAVVKEPQIVYESSNEKVKGLIMIFLLTLSILLNIILVWKR